MYGYKAEEALGKLISLIASEGWQSEVLGNMHKMLSGEGAGFLEVVRRRKDGTLFDASMSLAVLRDENGHAFGVSAIHRDVTEQKQA